MNIFSGAIFLFWNSFLTENPADNVLPKDDDFELDDRILGGTEAHVDEHPYMASIVAKIGRFPPRLVRFGGGASIVSKNWAVTAAHCAFIWTQYKSAFRNKAIYVRSNTSLWSSGNYLDHRIIYIAIHPNFEPDTSDYDLAVLKVVEPFNGANEAPINFAPKNYKYKDGTYATVLGWGSTAPDVLVAKVSEVLRKVDIKLYNWQQCVSSYAELGDAVTPRMICAIDDKKDACIYDSGGPLIQKGTLIGIVSWGYVICGDVNKPGVYVKISDFHDWISNITEH